MKSTILKSFVLSGLLALSACTTEDLDPTLAQSKSVEGSITDVSNLYGIIKGAYSGLTSTGYYGRDYIINNEVRTDNCWSNGNSGRFITQAEFQYNSNSGGFWDEAYDVIGLANIIIGTDISELTGSAAYGNHLKGQAYVIRALAHFDLVKQYGQQNSGGTLGVPYVVEFKGDDLFPSRDTVASNVTNIMADLQNGFDLMDDAQFDSTKQFISKYTAKAIESRVALYFGNYPAAEAAAQAVVSSGLYSIVPANSYVGSWASRSNANSIFELAFNNADNRGSNSLAFIYRTTGGGVYGDVRVTENARDLYAAGDVRGQIIGTEAGFVTNLGKYPSIDNADNVVIIRYEEVILNLAEAQFRNQNPAALNTLNLIPTNRGAAAHSAISPAVIWDERRKELMFEGHRYDDLMRSGTGVPKIAGSNQNITASLSYPNNLFAWPIPQAEIDANSNMVQNDGY